MASPVVGFTAVERVSTVLQVLRSTSHNGFPLLAPSRGSQRESRDGGGDSSSNGLDAESAPRGPGGGRTAGRLQGFVLRSQVGAGWGVWVRGAAAGQVFPACTREHPPFPLPPPLQLLVLLRHGAFCDEQGRYACALARRSAAAFEEALAYEMQAAAQSSAYGEPAAAAAGSSGVLEGEGHGSSGGCQSQFTCCPSAATQATAQWMWGRRAWALPPAWVRRVLDSPPLTTPACGAACQRRRCWMRQPTRPRRGWQTAEAPLL